MSADTLDILFVHIDPCIRAEKEAFALANRGHRVHLLCQGLNFQPNMRDICASVTHYADLAELGSLIRKRDDFDVVHCHNEPNEPTVAALDNTVNWVLEQGYRNVLLEVNNECDVPKYEHDILTPPRIHELIERAKNITRDGRRLLVGTSYGGGTIPRPNVVAASDFLLMHANFVADPDRIAAMVREARAVPGYRPMPILFNEDDHFDFDKPWNNFVAALSEYCSWGYFDPGRNDYADGYQSPPVQWGLNTERKQGFFRLLREITGA